MNDGSCLRIQGGWRVLREREEVGAENPEALYTHSQLDGQQCYSHLHVPLLPSSPGRFNQISSN